MRYFDWDDQNISSDLTPEFEFTRVYKENNRIGHIEYGI